MYIKEIWYTAFVCLYVFEGIYPKEQEWYPIHSLHLNLVMLIKHLKVVIMLSSCDQYKTSGMKLVPLSRVVDILDFSIDGPDTSIVNEDLKKIGVGQTTDECLGFIDRLALLAAETQQDIEDEVVQHDVETWSTFDGDFKQLAQWYRCITWNMK